MPRLKWRKGAREKGLAGGVQGERGFHLFLDGERIGSVSPITNGINKCIVTGWYWSVGSIDTIGMPWANTFRGPVTAVEEAKAQCLAYVKQWLDAKKEDKPDD